MKKPLVSFAALLLAGCNFAPDYRKPAMPDVGQFRETAEWKFAAPQDAAPRGPWWQLFGDAELDRLERKLDADNQTLKQALARHDQALAAARIAGAAQFPQVTYNAGANRDQRSRNVALPTHPNLYNDFTIQGSFSWELDFWGRVRNMVAGAEARAAASEADLAASKLALEATLAIDYLSLQGLDSLQEMFDRTVAADREALTYTQHRHDGGAAAQVDVDEAQLQLSNAQTQATNNRLLRAQLDHAIAILLGEAPANFTLPARPLTALPPPIAPGLPSALLERRPDIAAAERSVASANAQIGVAIAAFFPQFDLAAIGGIESAFTNSLFNAGSTLWAVGPQASGPLFDAGLRSAATDQARAAFDEAAAAYRQTVLTAYREVEDSLASLRRLEEESVTQGEALGAARRALSQAQTRYKGGLATYLEVITAQNAAVAAESGAIDVQSRRMVAAVNLIQALGGGWEGLQQTAGP